MNIAFVAHIINFRQLVVRFGTESVMICLVTVPPLISGETNVSRELEVTQHSAVTLECHAAGNPPPQISWLKNGNPLFLSPRSRLLSGDTLLRSVVRILL